MDPREVAVGPLDLAQLRLLPDPEDAEREKAHHVRDDRWKQAHQLAPEVRLRLNPADRGDREAEDKQRHAHREDPVGDRAQAVEARAGELVVVAVALHAVDCRGMPTPRDVIFFESQAQLRAWFEANHETAAELWVGYHRKRTGRASITWQDLVDVELCFGWIDSVRKPLDNDTSAQRVTPRRKGSIWSAVNIKRFEELDALGLTHSSGRAAFARRDERRSRVYSYENRSRGFDAATEAEFREHESAWSFFEYASRPAGPNGSSPASDVRRCSR